MRSRFAAGVLAIGAALAFFAIFRDWSLAARAGIVVALFLLLWLGERYRSGHRRSFCGS